MITDGRNLICGRSAAVSAGFNQKSGVIFVLLFASDEIRMLNVYDIDPVYADYLRQFDSRIPYVRYGEHDKFACGIVLTINGCCCNFRLLEEKSKLHSSLSGSAQDR